MTEQPRALGRNFIPDARDQAYPMRLVVPRAAPDRRWRYWWPSGWWGDQGSEPHCVAYSWLHKVHDGPRTRPHGAPALDPETLYCEAKKRDPWEGDCENSLYDGTSIRAGAKVLQEHGLIKEYRWAWDLVTVIDALLLVGPVILGTWWYEGMDRPAADGSVKLSGRIRGGHAFKVDGVNRNRAIVRCKNSWGRRWGVRGYFYLTFEQLEFLINRRGEACLPVGDHR